MPSRPSAEQSSSRSRLLRSAKRLFARHGYEQTATSAIAREAGTSESQLMRYFGGKVGLLDALFDEAWADVMERVGTAVSEADTSRDAIVEVLLTIASTLTRDPDLATLFLFEGRRIRGDARVRMSDGFQQFTETMRGLVRKAQAARELDPQLDASAVAAALIGAGEALLRDRALARITGGRSYAEREIRRTLDAMLSGFGGRPPRGARPRGAGRTRVAS